MHKGSCLCGAVRFTVSQSLEAPDACHCRACRKASGHYFVSTDVARRALEISGQENIRWFHSSEKIRRGFCGTCGSPLFWDPTHRDWIGIAMGAFDTPSDTHIKMHIFVSEKGDYYDLTDGLPQNPR